ncbi:hypothetical protein [Tautonia marina]|uniref:hypothetical protein n=1 Tax=Tautonia marina TaxID=2653855 RepID=UPI0012612B5D|nr:hypothetical protein [Tautonia marina]
MTARAVVLAAESLACIYVGFLAYMLSGWMLDDDLAFRLAPSGWTWIAARRFASWALVGLAFGGGIILANRLLLPRAKRASLWLGVSAAVLILAASLAGAVRFIVEKPFL